MPEYWTNTTDLTKVAAAIREKGGTSDLLVYPDEFVSAIRNLSSGGAGGLSVLKVNLDKITSSSFEDNYKHTVCTIFYTPFIFFSWDITDEDDLVFIDDETRLIRIVAYYIPSLNLNFGYGLATYMDNGNTVIDINKVEFDKESRRLVYTDEYADEFYAWSSNSGVGTIVTFDSITS